LRVKLVHFPINPLQSPRDPLVTKSALKEKGLTAEAVVADFVFNNIQPLKDRAHPAYLYNGINDSIRVTNKRIPTTNLLSRLDMILRGRVLNASAPVAYSAWNLPSHRSFFKFVSNPSARDGGLGLRVRPSPEDIEGLIAPLWSLPKGERQTHFEMSASMDGEEMDVVLNLLAGESSESTHAEPMAIMDGQELVGMETTQKPEEVRPKRPRRVSRPTAPVEEKSKKRRLRRLSSLDHGAGPSVPVCDEVPAEVLPEVDPNGCAHAEVDPNGCGRLEVDPNGCDCAPAVVRIYDEDEEEKEEEVPLIRKNRRHYRGSKGDSDIPSLALSALVTLQELSITDFDQALEEVVPEDMLSEPTADDMMAICSEILATGLEVSRAVSRAPSTLEGSLQR
jgi:hypothetical protein